MLDEGDDWLKPPQSSKTRKLTVSTVEPHYCCLSKETDALSWWLNKGAEFLGQTAGGLASAHSDPMLSAGLSIAVTEALRNVGHEIRKWKLGPREEGRTGAIFMYTRLAVERRLASGAKLRTDGFFVPDETGRSTAEAIAEAIVLAAEREHEERKIRHFGNLYAFIATRDDIDPGLANHLVRLAKGLSFRQYCILALPQSTLKGGLYQGRTSKDEAISEPKYSALLESHELYEKRLVIFPNVLGIPNLYPAQMRFYEMQLFGIGWFLYEGLRLEDLSTIDLRPVAKLLSE